ncbi:MAG TPA: hypothetical protein VE646_04770, partial [Actinomycetota bacterium]|nr:hypothetical protein [Actinomycetota bacterium]
MTEATAPTGLRAESPAFIARPRQRAGIALTVLALILTIGAYALVGLGKKGHLPTNLALYGSIFVVGYAGAYLTIRRTAPWADPAMFPVAGVLTGLGFAVIFRLSGGLAAEQATWVVVGLIAFIATLLVVRDHRQLDAYTYTIGLV